MKKVLSFIILMVCAVTGAWADSETTLNVGSNGSTVKYGDRWGGQLFAILNSNNENDFAEWYYSEANTGQLDDYLKVLRVTGSGAKIPLTGCTPSYPNSYIKLSGGEWEAPSIEIHTDNAESQSALSIWLNNTRNSSLFSCADMTKLTITGQNPHWRYENGSNKGVITLKKGSDGKAYFDIEVERGSATALYNSFVSDNSLFSSIPGRIYINDANTSYIDLAGTSATVTSANENDFATWVANNPDALSSVTNYTFNGNAKFTTDGDANYVVINGNTATATCTDNSTSLHTWANANSVYLNSVQTVNFTSETTIYMTDPVDEAKRVVVSGNNLTVYCEDIADYNNWKNNALNSKIVNGKTVKTVGVKMKLDDDCYIEFSEDGKTAYVHALHAGCLTNLYNTFIAPNGNPKTESFPDGTTLVFGNDCVLSNEDVAKVLTGGTDQWKLYFDFFDVTNNNDQMTVAAIDAAINAGVESMASSYKSQYGIILPYNSTIGTSKMIRSNGNTHGDGSTFTKYAAYYRESETAKNLTLHVWDKQYWNGWGNISANNYAEAAAQLNTHNEIKNAETVTVSTLTNTSFDLSKLDASKVKIEITNDDMIKDVWNQSAPNTNIPSLADIYVVSSVPGGFNSNVETTGTKATPTNLLKISGQISSSDLAAISDFTDGPRVLDLSAATGVTPAYVSAITNNKIEYVILPNGWEKDYVNAAANITNMPNLKTAISTSSDQKELVAYVNVAGTLAAARCLATGIAAGSTFPDKKGLTSVILSGNLNAADINAQGKVGADGHWTTSSNQAAGLNQEQATITSIDLEHAVFANQEDMNFYKAGFEGLTNVVLPTSKSMTLIPEDCLNNNHSLKEICIPYNYQIIRSGAFNGTAVDHITTTDAIGGALIDNGDHTWTLSANITELGSVPSERGAFVPQVFQHDLLVTDIYILATKTPKCYAGVFPANASYGYGGASGSDTYCRDRYFNSTDRKSKAWIMLRFPSEASYNAAKAAGQATNLTYGEMMANYTDTTKVYTKKEQTGAVDANGKPIPWPTRQEANRTYNQGSRGLTWLAWDPTSGTSQTGEDGAIAGGAGPSGAEVGSKATNDGMPATTAGYTFNADYMGWHQIALAMATYYEPAERVVNEKIVREYEEAGWYTFCIPFNMSYKQVVEMLGVPKSEGNVYNVLDGDTITSNIMPDIRQLSSVTRKAAANGKPNIVMLRMTNNLWEHPTAGYTGYLQITHNTNSVTTQLVSAEPYNASSNIDDRLSLIGGRPYIIKAYKRKQVVDGVDQFKIKGQNLGKYVLERYADQFGIESSIVQNTKYESYECYEQLGDSTLQSLRFAKPFENHKVQAVRDGENSAYLTYETDENGQTVTKKYYYTMVGQFWQQPLPKYCLYMSKGNWYRYTDTSLNYTWDPYKCVIMATQELVKVEGDKHYGGGFRRDDEYTNYPQVEEGTTDLIKTEFKLGFLDGRDDDDFDRNGTSSRYIFGLDDDIIEFDEDGNEVTAIERLDGEDIVPAGSKIYNVAGQYVGESLNGLTKGLYIVNGKKIVIK